MNIKVSGYSFFIEDNWLKKANIVPFSMTDRNYKYKEDSQDVLIVDISQIDPDIRGKDVPIFKEGEVDGKIKTREERVLDILMAFKDNTPLPPVEIIESKNKNYRFKLYHGCHRLHLSLSVGFNFIPAIIRSDL